MSFLKTFPDFQKRSKTKSTLLMGSKIVFQKAVVRRYSVKKFLRNFAKFAGKHLCQSLFFNKVAV